MQQRTKQETPLWKIIVGVSVGALLAGFIGWAVRLWMINQAVQHITDTANQASQRILENTNRQMQELQQREADRREAAEQIKQQEAQRLADMQRQQALAQMQAIAAETAKEEAWKRYYQRPAHCDDAVGDAFVECGNHFIRAKRKFEALHEAGKL